MDSFANSIFYSLYCHLPATIVSYDRAKQMATVQIGLQRVIPSYVPSAGFTTANYKPIEDVPVFFLQGGGLSIGVDPVAGDPCMLAIMDRNMDVWLKNGGQQPPASDRAHDLSDCFALVGFNPTNAPLLPARLAGEAGISEPLVGTGAKIVVKDGKISIANNAQGLAAIMSTLLTALAAAQQTDGSTFNATAVTAINAAKTALAALLY